MYTQCPECQIAFRITADVLKQAGGRVRCGSCNTAFNAIEYLSETAPQTGAGAAPRPDADAGRELMEKLDELAGPGDVRIEDTGIEWRVLGDDDDDTADGPSADTSTDDTGSIRWFIEDTGDAPDDGIPEIVDTDADDVTAGGAPDEQAPLEFGPDEPAEPRYDDNTPLPEDFDRNDETAPPPAPQRRESDRVPEPTEEFLEAQGDLELGEPEEWMELLGEFEDEQEHARGRRADADEADADAADESSASLPIEVEEELAAIHTELSSRPARPDDSDSPGDDGGVEDIVLDAGDDDEPDDEALAPDGTGLSPEEDAPEEADDEAEPPEGGPEPAAGRGYAETTGEFEQRIAEAEFALADTEVDAADTAGGDEPQPEELTLEEEPADAGSDASRDEGDEAPSLPIDEDLLRAMEDEDLAATFTADDGTPLVETIIMEGDRVQEAIHAAAETQEDDTGTGDDDGLTGSRSLADTYMLNRRAARGRRFRMPGKGVIAGIVLLLLLLGAQFVHYSRDRLATYGSFNQTVAPVYRMFGRPVTPEWDVTGWQFEATTGSETDELLTISSRIANRAGQPLPYPLLHVSLTDRWEEIIGSRVLEPNEYLASDADPRRPVPPGERFTAVITIQSPSAEATGFKLNVCYRIDPGRLRCAVEDFKP